jgi:hypothetical protein
MQLPQSLQPLQCDRQSWRCVIDPLLVFTKYGAPLVRQTSSRMELWIARELWHILNNVNFYLQQPGLLNPAVLFPHQQLDQEYGLLQETLLSLQQWDALRLATDLSRLHFFWLGDSLKESFIPTSIDTDLLRHWEAIAASLDRHLKQRLVKENILSLALRDTIALTTSLGSAFILTHQSRTNGEDNPGPEICQILEVWGIPCQALPPQNPIVSIERDSLRQMLISTNTAKFLWGGIRLAVLHLLLPTVPGPPAISHRPPSTVLLQAENPIPNWEYPEQIWAEAKGFWYFL